MHTIAPTAVVDEIIDALAQPWGGERNLTVWDALGTVVDDVDTCLVDLNGSVQVSVPTDRSARTVEGVLRRVVGPDGDLRKWRRADGMWVIQTLAGQ